MRDYQDRNHDDRDDHLAENQRIGKRIAQDNRYQNRQEEYRSGRDYRNQPQPGDEGRQHYGADPNSAYRNSNINYGDNRDRREPNRGGYDNHRHDQGNWRQDQNNWPRDRGQEQWNRESRHPQDGHYNQHRSQHNSYYNQNDRREQDNRFNQSDNQFYQGQEPRMFDDRKHFQAEDYRYGSGRRQWESPGGYDDRHNDRDDRNNRDPEQRGFFGRLANEIREDWRTFTQPDDDQDRRQNRHSDQRNFNRGYESGPRWADDDPRRENEERRNRNRDENHYRR